MKEEEQETDLFTMLNQNRAQYGANKCSLVFQFPNTIYE